MSASSSKSDDLQYRIEEWKQSMSGWRTILLPLNNIFEWEHNYIPLIIFGLLTSIFLLLRHLNPPALALISCLVLIVEHIDLFGSVAFRMVHKNDPSKTTIDDEKYSRLCERITRLERLIKQQYQSVLKMRQESPTMYLILGSILLGFLAICSQRIDNVFLAYLIMLLLCLTPGAYNQYNLWNNKIL